MKPGFKIAKCADFVGTQLWVGIRRMTGGGGAVWQCCYILLHTLEVKVSVSWLLLCKVACYRNKVKPAVKMSDDVNSVVLSPVTPPLWVQQGRLSCKNQQKPGTKITRLQAPASSGQGWHQPEQILQCMIMEEPSDSWILTTEQHTTAAGSRCSAEVSAGKMGSPHSSTEPL